MVTRFVLNALLHHVGLSWIIGLNKKLEYDIDDHNSYCLPNGPWYKTSIWKKLYGIFIEIIIGHARSYNGIETLQPPLWYVQSHWYHDQL